MVELMGSPEKQPWWGGKLETSGGVAMPAQIWSPNSGRADVLLRRRAKLRFGPVSLASSNAGGSRCACSLYI